MPLYLDASVIAALVLEEPTSAAVTAMLTRMGSGCIVSDFASAEVSAAVSRRVRMNLDDASAAGIRLRALDEFRAAVGPTLPIESEDIATAETLVRTFELKLRAPDALHAAVCLRRDLGLTTLDAGLAEAALMLGIECVDPRDGLPYQGTP